MLIWWYAVKKRIGTCALDFPKNVFSVFRETLLPLIHQVWQPLKLLFESENIFVVSKAFKALHVFAVCAKDFIHRRTLTDVFPAIIKYLKKLKV